MNFTHIILDFISNIILLLVGVVFPGYLCWQLTKEVWMGWQKGRMSLGGHITRAVFTRADNPIRFFIASGIWLVIIVSILSMVLVVFIAVMNMAWLGIKEIF